MSNNEEKYIFIADQGDLDILIERFAKKELFAGQFKFPEREFFVALLESLNINYDDFTKKYFHYDGNRNLHISESQSGYVWISTFGLIAKEKATTNNAVNSCVNQYTVISLLLEKALNVSQSDTVYDVDSYNFGFLGELSPAIFHNSLFYVELLCKAYLSLNDIQPPHTHKLTVIYKKTVETMFLKNHNDSVFHLRVLYPLYRFVDHINSLPNTFKEQFVKYDDNPHDDTVIVFQPERLADLSTVLEIANDFIVDYFYMKDNTHYIKPGVYQRLLDKAKTENLKKKIKEMHGYLTQKDLNYSITNC